MEITPGSAATPQPEEKPITDGAAAETAGAEIAPPSPAASEAEAVSEAAPTPVAEPASQPVAAPAAAAEPSAIASTVSVPAEPGASDGEGGEFQLLLAKLNEQLGGVDLASLWEQSKQPLKLIGLALLLILVLQLLGAVLGTLDHVPMLPRILQLIGLIWLSLFASQRLVRSDERKKIIDAVSSTWGDITGKN